MSTPRPTEPMPAWERELLSGMTRREEILNNAVALITGHRQADYGDPVDNCRTIAALWTVTLGVPVAPWQVALCMGQLKTVRILNDPQHADSWADALGWTAIGAEAAAVEA